MAEIWAEGRAGLGGKRSVLKPQLYLRLTCFEQIPSPLWASVFLPAPSVILTTMPLSSLTEQAFTISEPLLLLFLPLKMPGSSLPDRHFINQGPVPMPPPLGSLPGFSSDSLLRALLVAAQMFVINSLPALS